MDRRTFLKTTMLAGGSLLTGRSWLGMNGAVGGEGGFGEERDGTVYGIYFSATETTKTIVEAMLGEFSDTAVTCDLLRRPFVSEYDVETDDLAIVGVPVYSGRVPEVALRSLKNLRGNNTPAIAIVVYGNREYDDALLELKDSLEENGFVVVAGAAFIGQHSIFPNVAKGRPDEDDMDAVVEFSRLCENRLAEYGARGVMEALSVKGNKPYREAPPSSGLVPVIDNESCTRCTLCVAVCPVKALRFERASRQVLRDDKTCIGCAACIHVCPVGAQAFRGEKYEAFGKTFEQMCAERREPEFFL